MEKIIYWIFVSSENRSILKGKYFRLDSGLDHASQVAKEARTQTQA